MAATMEISNDGRGWIMTALSGVACVFGASFICVDIIVRQFPGKRNFNIKENRTFLAFSLSLSFGVMLFSALYSMLPSAKSSLMRGDYSSKEAAWILIACFIGGVVGIQILSRVMHHYLPHDVVSCEYTHKDEEAHKEGADSHEHGPPHDHETSHHAPSRTEQNTKNSSTVRASRWESRSQMHQRLSPQRSQRETHHTESRTATSQTQQKPTLRSKISSTFAKLASGQDESCDCDGPCRGYSDLCPSERFKNASAKGGFKAPKATMGINRPSALHSATATESTPLLHDINEQLLARPHTRAANENVDAHPLDSEHRHQHQTSEHSSTTFVAESDGQDTSHKTHPHIPDQHSITGSGNHSAASHHHHHIPTNQFASIGLQTCIAIALHKLPEGFITYATNHANPKLGVSVFLALFIHNIMEGFVMALPLYLAIDNRAKAMMITLVLGGLSQPAGAGVAALWFRLAGQSGWTPSEAGYGGMFAVTAGIMASVALQLYAEAVGKSRSKMTCLIGAFLGMAILGCSSALTA